MPEEDKKGHWLSPSVVIYLVYESLGTIACIVCLVKIIMQRRMIKRLKLRISAGKFIIYIVEQL